MHINARPQEFMSRSNKIHKNKYDYSRVEYKNNRTKITIICPTHGQFKQLPSSHLRGSGCPKCAKSDPRRKIDTKEFINRAMEIHGDIYDYSKSNYVNNKTKIAIICKKHGEFQQMPMNHLSGSKCHMCSGKHKLTLEEFIQKAKLVHNNKYDYSKVDYKNNSTKVIIMCPTHGEFWQKPTKHLSGQGCKQCGREKSKRKRTVSEFIHIANTIHDNKFDYSEVTYNKGSDIIRINCPNHGPFDQKAQEHLISKYGCPECAKNNVTNTLKFGIEEFIEKAKSTHNNKYDYSETKYNRALDKVTIICPSHGRFKQLPIHHWRGHGCPKCAQTISSGHQEIINFIKSSCTKEIKINDRETISPLELDIHIPELNFAIEYNGMFYHSFDKPETTKESHKHKNKHLTAINKNIDLIQINEYEWIEKPEIIKSIISNKLMKSNRIFARKCKIVEINNEQHKQFIDANHIYGQGRYPRVSYGLVHDDILICVMSFNKHHKYEWEINRLASKLNHTIIGGASRLFKNFLREHKPKQILTYADARFGCGNVYKKLGFVNMGMTNPGYGYIKNLRYFKRQKFQKHKLRNLLEYFDPNITEAENMFANGYRRLWDAGHYRYVYDTE